MIELDEIIELFKEIEDGCEYGPLGVFVLEDGSYWYCNRDSILTEDIEFRQANVNMQEALALSLLEPEEQFLHREDEIAQDIKMEQSMDVQNLDYYGTRQEAINEIMKGAFEPAFGSDFSL